MVPVVLWMCSKKTNRYTDVFAESPLMPTAFCLRLQTQKSIDIQTCLQKWPVTLTKFCMGVQTRRSVDIQTCLQNGLLRPLNCVWACRQEGNQSICRRVRRTACYTHYILVGACRQEGNQSICRRVRRMACYTHYILVGACGQEGN